jgi:phosphoglycolate phosphatase
MNWNAVDLVIFDLDGTLVDSSLDIANACNYALAGLGQEAWPVERITKLIGGGSTALVHQVLAGRQELFKDAFRLFSEHYRAHLLDHTRLYEGVREVIVGLSEKRLAVMSNKRQAFCDPIIDGLHIRNAFQLVVGGDTPKQKKPHPDSIHYVCDALRIDPARTVMIGDSPVDVQAGKAAGTLTIGITGGFCSREEILQSNPDWIFPTAGHLQKSVTSGNPQKI